MSKVQDLANQIPEPAPEKDGMIQGRVPKVVKAEVRRILDERGLTWDDLLQSACEDLIVAHCPHKSQKISKADGVRISTCLSCGREVKK